MRQGPFIKIKGLLIFAGNIYRVKEMKVEEIVSLRVQMVGLGYKEGEVTAFIHDVTGDTPIDKLNDHECQELIEYLSSYISFATKSKHLITKAK